MSNGKIDEATVEALLLGPQADRDRYLLICAVETRRAIDDIPGIIERAIEQQRRKDFRTVTVIATVIATIISLLTPYITRMI